MWWSAKQHLGIITGKKCPTPHQSFARTSQMPASPQGEAFGAALRRAAAWVMPPYSKVFDIPINSNLSLYFLPVVG
jgi:hypothetical protein